MEFSLNDYLFGPLDSEYCSYFYFLSVMHFCIFIFIITSVVISVIMGNKKFDTKMISTMLFGSLLYAVLYFQNRLLHSMCISNDGYHNGKKDNNNRQS